MPTVLITGASRGIGLELARQYAADRWRVIATCRAPRQESDLSAVKGEVQIHPLDVVDAQQVDRLARLLKDEAIDILINNAGLYGPDAAEFSLIDHEAWQKVLAVNTMAPLKISAALLENVARSRGKCIVTISSKMGSIGENSSGNSVVYRSSKAGVNAVMRTFANAVRHRDVIVVLLCPGWVKTDMGGPNALLTPEESVRSLRRCIGNLTIADSGRYLNHDGTENPW